jgi:hypothetical protein
VEAFARQAVGKIKERALVWDEGMEDEETPLEVVVEKGSEWIEWNGAGSGKGKGGGAAGMRILVGGSAQGMVKFMNRATRKKVAVAEYYHACKHQPTKDLEGTMWYGGVWGQTLQLRADWAGEDVRRQLKDEVDDQWAFVVDFGQLTGIVHAHAVGSLYGKGEREVANMIGMKIMERVLDVTHLGWAGPEGQGYGTVRVEGQGAHGDWVLGLPMAIEIESVGFKYVTISARREDMGMCTHCHTEKREGGSERCKEGCDDRVREEIKRLSKRPETRTRAWPEEVQMEQGARKKARTKKESGDTSQRQRFE